MKRWVVEKRLDRLKFARQKQGYCYFSAAATLFAPELSDARLSWAKNAVLTTVVDDFFDVGGSEEELVNLIKLIEKYVTFPLSVSLFSGSFFSVQKHDLWRMECRWDVDGSTDFCSEQVEILFSALHSTICEIGNKSCRWQGRDVTSHVINIVR